VNYKKKWQRKKSGEWLYCPSSGADQIRYEIKSLYDH